MSQRRKKAEFLRKSVGCLMLPAAVVEAGDGIISGAGGEEIRDVRHVQKSNVADIQFALF